MNDFMPLIARLLVLQQRAKSRLNAAGSRNHSSGSFHHRLPR
eukprot:CAMPEP_0182898118 /NCGR_PEP_ID=MMETSP0034_2-20130328/27302_1 /TAXON_ID=156128 /ORGANISM="Nephroselmis pyriformis, Strain CCMP717" /LENGTH=41 /DNA_ID= /DNA_START= /DNA_END= /DNA_ORIENTATION=